MSVLLYRKLKLRLRRFWQRTEARFKRKLVAAIAAAIHALLYTSVAGVSIEMFAYDAWYRIRGPIPPPKDVVIVTLDNRSEDVLKISPLEPWPRRYYAEFLHAMREKGARRVVLDVFFRAKGPSEEDDKLLAEALRGVDSAIGSFLAPALYTNPDGSKVRVVRDEQPLALFREAAGRVVCMQIWLNRDFDNVVRHISEYAGPLKDRIPLVYALEGIFDARHEVPTSNDLINYYGPPGSLSMVSYVDAVRNAPAELFKGKVVFLGKHLPTSYLRSEEKDTFTMPVRSMAINGVEIHATVAGNLLEKSWIRRLPPEVELVFLTISVLVLSYILLSFRIVRAGIILLGAQAAWCCAAYVCFRDCFFLPGAIMSFIVLPLIFCGSVFLTALSLYRSFREVEKAMGVNLTK